MSKSTQILLAGEGGQGIQTIAKIITDVAATQGMMVSYIPVFGVEQRGTPSVALIILSDETIYYPRFDEADIVVVLQKRAIASIERYITKKTKVIFDSSTLSESVFSKNPSVFLGIPATEIAHTKLSPKSFNLIVTGKLGQILNLDKDKTWAKIEQLLGKKMKTAEIREANKSALETGYNFIFETNKFTKPTYQPAIGKIVVRGHDKIAQIYPERCKGCGICIVKCPVGALRFSDTLGVFGTPVPEIDLEKCINCGNCFRFCPDGAIGVEKDVKK